MAKGQKNTAWRNSEAQDRFLKSLKEKGKTRFEFRGIDIELKERFAENAKTKGMTHTGYLKYLMDLEEGIIKA